MFVKNIKNMQFSDWIFKIYNHINLDYNQVCNKILFIHIYLMHEIFLKSYGQSLVTKLVVT